MEPRSNNRLLSSLVVCVKCCNHKSFFFGRMCVFTSSNWDLGKDLWQCRCGLLAQFSPSLLSSRIAPVSGMVTLCLCDNASLIHTHYSNGCWYKELLTSLGRKGITEALGCLLFASPSLWRPAPPLTNGRRLFLMRRCAHACLIVTKIYEFGCLLAH